MLRGRFFRPILYGGTFRVDLSVRLPNRCDHPGLYSLPASPQKYFFCLIYPLFPPTLSFPANPDGFPSWLPVLSSVVFRVSVPLTACFHPLSPGNLYLPRFRCLPRPAVAREPLLYSPSRDSLPSESRCSPSSVVSRGPHPLRSRPPPVARLPHCSLDLPAV